MKSFKQHLEETVGKAGLAYELKVYNAMKGAKIPDLDVGDKPGAGFSNVGSGDIEAIYKNNPFNIEIKLSAKDQMGGGSIRYDRQTQALTPSVKLAASTEDEDLSVLMQVTKDKIPQINAYLDFLGTQYPQELHQEYARSGVPFVASTAARAEAVRQGYQKAIQGYVKLDSRYIKNLYNGKNVYYIQIGGKGLFYMNENPLNLPVPEFKGEMQVEVRIGYAGDSRGSISRAFTKKAGSEETIQARRAEMRCIGRMLTTSKSPYSLDNEADVKKLFGVE